MLKFQKRMGLKNFLQASLFALAMSAAAPAAASSASALLDSSGSAPKTTILEDFIRKPAPKDYLENRIEMKKRASEPSPMLKDILNDSSLTKEEKRMYKSLSDDVRAATRTEGEWIYFRQCSTKVKGKVVPVNVVFKYIHGPRGGSGETEITVWLSEEALYCKTGIEQMVLHLFSKEETALSTKIYDINLNQHLKLATYASVDYRIKGTDIIADPSDEIIKKALKEVGLSAATINKLFLLEDAYNAIGKSDRTARALSAGNEFAKGFHVYNNTITYNGYFKEATGSEPFTPKLVQVRVKKGEQSAFAFELHISVIDYDEIYFGGGYVGEKRRRGKEIVVGDTLPLVSKKRIPALEKVIDEDTLNLSE
ncbi:MAG: hypothetical protein WC475_03000 [Candidatus Paceibacterota bacterium]